ncbi:MAG TPA: serine hydrolase domain-containing protein [Blastocatellia bacterium]|jgi:CubicO group peptidase (beta-lactamase class C family)|nr:serine hydrolase domain-containing protein [Blastocatellia bacterium]
MITRHAFSRAALVILMFASIPAAQTTSQLPADKIEKIERAISAEMSRQNIPALSVAIVADRKLRWSNGYGLADLENYIPAKSATVYRLGSISKTITAIAVMQLAERGRLDLDAPVQKYCPAFPQKQWPTTARQLLGHLAGVRHYKSEAEFLSTRHYNSVVEGLDMFKDDPLLHEPGTKYSYTTHGYSILGCAVEGASGMKFADYVRENVFKPAGMDTMRVDDVFEIIPNRAQGYFKNQGGQLRNSTLADTSYKIPGGGFCSTVIDLARFAIAVQEGALVKQQTLDQMWTRQKTRDGKETSYGLGWGLSDRSGLKEVQHGGAQQRVTTNLYMIPEKGLAVVLMANVEGASLNALSRQIADIALTQ